MEEQTSDSNKEKSELEKVKHISILLKSQRLFNVNELCE